jgi:hypothetical protein
VKLDNDGVQGTSNEIDKSTPPTLAGTGLYDYCFVDENAGSIVRV